MERSEMRKILEEIARESPNPTARVSAIRALRQLKEDAEDEKSAVQEGFEELDKGKPPSFAELYKARPKVRHLDENRKCA
jgi:hypothetical protein